MRVATDESTARADDPHDGWDTLLHRSTARLRAHGVQLPPAALDAVVRDVLLDATRFALHWAER